MRKAQTDAEIRRMFIEEVVLDLARGMDKENKAAHAQISALEMAGALSDEVKVTRKMEAFK